MAPRRPNRSGFNVLLGVVLFAATYVLMFGQGLDPTDESWFLWVSQRLQNGDHLYRDVYFVSTPLSVWITQPLFRVIGNEVLVLRAAEALCFTVSALLGVSIVARCGVRRTGQVVFALALFVYGSPVVIYAGFYATLATLFALAALRCGVEWIEVRSGDDRRRSLWWLAGAGACAGLCFGSKPTVGGYMLVALVGTIAVAHWPRIVRRAALVDYAAVGVLWAVVGAATLFPVLAGGGWSAFYGDVVAEKSSTLGFSFDFPDQLRQVGDVLPGATKSGTSAQHYAGTMFAMLLLIWLVLLASIVLAFRRPGARTRVAACVFAALVGVASMYPFSGREHLVAAMPLLLTAAVGAWASVRPASNQTMGRAVGIGALSLAVVWLAAGVVVDAAQLTTRNSVPSTLTHLRGPIIDQSKEAAFRAEYERIRAVTGDTVFIVRPDAAYFYLAGRMRDPLPFDVPQLTDLGGGGEAGVIHMLRHRDAKWVCLRNAADPPQFRTLEPVHLEAYVRRHFERVTTTKKCELYRQR